MHARVTFRSGFFAPVPGEEEETNPGLHGRALAVWLAAEPRKRGVPVESILTEDFGWVVMVSSRPVPLWLGCGNVAGSADEWHVFPAAEPSLARRIFHREATKAALEALWDHVEELIPQIPGVIL